jgi:hypothetical protein
LKLDEANKQLDAGAESFKSIFKPAEWEKIGFGLVGGLMSGIDKAEPLAHATVEKLFQGTTQAGKDAVGAHSPSRVWAGIGSDMIAGVNLGLRGGRSRVMASAGFALGGVPNIPALPVPAMQGGRAGGGFGGNSRSLSIGDIHLHLPGGQTQQATGTVTLPVAEVRMLIAQIFEGIAIEKGALA